MTEIIRPVLPEDAAGIARVHVDTWHTAYKGIVPDETLANLSYEQRTQQWATNLSKPERKAFTHVAQEEHGHIVGFVMGGPGRGEIEPAYASELYAIYILKEYQRHGLGRRLTLALVEDLVRVGIYSMMVWVLIENPACYFYEALGGRPIRTGQIEIGGQMLEELAYGWKDIRLLC
ncbi:MAG: GNAT family N-acetyltransferase [Chloroflexi bacterium]|nr:GNAT family N-acetyltransferase [Chloroflexota bacterium]